MHDDDLAPLVRDPHMTTPEAALALMTLAHEVALDPDIAADVLLTMTEQLRPGGGCRGRWPRTPTRMRCSPRRRRTRCWTH